MGFKSAKTYYIFIGLFKTYPTPKLKIKNIVLQIPHIFNKEIQFMRYVNMSQYDWLHLKWILFISMVEP